MENVILFFDLLEVVLLMLVFVEIEVFDEIYFSVLLQYNFNLLVLFESFMNIDIDVLFNNIGSLFVV